MFRSLAKQIDICDLPTDIPLSKLLLDFGV